jgi:pyruvate,orthophosphate dikinase
VVWGVTDQHVALFLCLVFLQDFEGIFRAMDGFPVTIRMLDPPLHEFLPQEGPALKKLCEQLAKELNTDTETVTRRLEGLHECNPMMVSVVVLLCIRS